MAGRMCWPCCPAWLCRCFPDERDAGLDAISSVFWGDVLSAVTGLPFLLGEEKTGAIALTSLLVLGVFQVAVAISC